ncbi:MAG: hypothetical protein ACRCYP_01765, partial [Alphaproteobacteria bacterium]
MAELATADTRTGEQGAQELQNQGMIAEIEFVKLLAKTIGDLIGKDITENDVIVKVGTNNAWPSDEPNIDLLAKLKDGFSNPDSKASVRVFLEGDDGKRELLFQQTAGKVVSDPQGLKTAIQSGLIESVVNAPDQPTVVQSKHEAIPEFFGLDIAQGLTADKVSQMGDMSLAIAYDKAEYSRQQLNELGGRMQ